MIGYLRLIVELSLVKTCNASLVLYIGLLLELAWPGCRLLSGNADLDSDVNAKLPRLTQNVSFAAIEFKIALRID